MFHNRLMTFFAVVFLGTITSTLAFGAPKPVLSDEMLTARTKLIYSNQDEYKDKVYGAWYGKLIGLILGQPTEGWTKQQIEEKARRINAYPVTYYFPSSFDSSLKGFLAGNFDGSPANDDSDLMLTSLLALRENGIGLTSRNIAEAWVKYVRGACTAEGIALANFKKGIWPPESAAIDNPYDEWIGAQMRGEIWGMIAPGMPKVAARYAALDASISHNRNGIYGEQFISAALSVAMVEKSPEKVIRTALTAIPDDCVYASAIKDILKWHKENLDWQSAWELLDKKWGVFEDGSRTRKFKDDRFNTDKDLYQWPDQKWVVADVNGAACTLALLYGEGDFSSSICIAAMCGYDNDCNSGTVGAILGAMHGEKAIPDRWKSPIRDIYHSGLCLTERDLKISKLAEETARYGQQVMEKQNIGKHD
ncbi:MAG: ADP-ribosylglycohydrolase family protein [Armatimonadota bacterium]